jgi:predicted aspartyl protease
MIKGDKPPKRREIKLDGTINTTRGRRWIQPEVDSGCERTCIRPKIVQKQQLRTQKIPAIPIINADGSPNRQRIADEVAKIELNLDGHQENMEALILDIGNTDMLLGHDWLVHHNPTVNWKTGNITFNRCPKECKIKHSNLHINMKDSNRRKYRTRMVTIKDVDAPRKSGQLMNPDDPIIEQIITKKEKTTRRPKYLEPFAHLFEKQNFDKLPKHREWDHEINLTPDAPKEIPSKTYPMTQKELDTLDTFVEEGLRTGKIRPSKSPYAAPCFFIGKKDSPDKRFIQDYRTVNKYTIKDKFPLPRIVDQLDTLRDTKYFNKMDIIWGYNNIRIKEGDEWKAQ